MSRINVLHIFKFYLPHAGGVERVIQVIAEGLIDKGIEPKILVCSHDRSLKSTEEIVGTVEVTRSNYLGALFSTPLSTNFLINLLHLSKSANILHLHSPFPLGEISYLLLKLQGKRLVVTYHADISQTRWAFFAPFYKPVLKRLLEKADRIIITSPAIVESSPVLHTFLNKCQVIPLAIDLKKWNPVSPEKTKELRASLGIESDKIVLFVGRLAPYKGLDYLITAMQKINAELIIVGGGNLRTHLKEESSKLGLNNKIHFVGQVSEDELPIYYSIANVFVLPSINGGEAFGLVQLEAMAFGVPVVNTNLPTGVTFVSPHNETGLTVPPRDSAALANAINMILEDDVLRQRFSQNALKRVKFFSLDKMLREMYNVYADVLSS